MIRFPKLAKGLTVQERKVLLIGLLSILAAYVFYGVLSSTGTFNNEVWNLGGAIVGFLASAITLNWVYGKGFLKPHHHKMESDTGANVDAAVLIEGHNEITSTMIRIVQQAETYIYTIGGRSRNDAYLSEMTRRVQMGDTRYIRVLTGDHIRHSLCDHLHAVLDYVELGYYKEDRFGGVLVTHDTTFIALPSPSETILDKALVLRSERVASDYRAYVTELLGGTDNSVTLDSAFIIGKCKGCQSANGAR